MKLPICVVGLGMGYGHARIYNEMQDKVDLYVCDVDENKIQRAKSELNIKGTFKDLNEAAKCKEIVALDTALPHYLHKEACLKAAKYNKHFLTEKPIARTLKEADTMIKASKDAGIVFMVAENYRFLSTAIKARELVEKGVIGKPFLIRTYEMWLSGIPGWRRDKIKQGGGNLIDSGIHLVNTLRLLANSKPEIVFSQNCREVVLEMEGEDTNLVQVRFENGIIGDLITSWGIMHGGVQCLFTIHGTEGTLWDCSGLNLMTKEMCSKKEPAQKVEVPRTDTHREVVNHFIDCIVNNKEPIMNGEEGKKDLEIVVAAYKSAKTGKAVKL